MTDTKAKEIAVATKFEHWLGFFCGCLVCFALPAAAIEWIWRGEWRWLPTVIVVLLVCALLHHVAEEKLAKLKASA